MTASERNSWFEAQTTSLRPVLLRKALQLVLNPEDAEDLVQQAFFQAYRGLSQFETGTNFKAWVFRILINLCINRKRRSAKFPEWQFAEGFELRDGRPAETDMTPENAVRLAEGMDERVVRAVRGVPEEYTAILLLQAFGGYSYEQIGKILGIPIGTVMSRLWRARNLLQKDLYEYASDSGALRRTRPYWGASRRMA